MLKGKLAWLSGIPTETKADVSTDPHKTAGLIQNDYLLSNDVNGNASVCYAGTPEGKFL